MLFSHPEIARILNRDFECAWESLRPVPHVTIDFGNGHVLERTLLGNVATFFTRSDGVTFDIVPGLVDPVEYEKRLTQALRLYPLVKGNNPDPEAAFEDMRAALAAYHGDPLAWSDQPAEEIVDALRLDSMVADLSKGLIERPIKSLARDLHVLRLQEDGAVYTPSGEGPEDRLAADTAYNREHRNPLVREMLVADRLHTPATLTASLFRDVLHTDLDDPYLGLAPNVIGGELGRR